jgi:hypothetical protein
MQVFSRFTAALLCALGCSDPRPPPSEPPPPVLNESLCTLPSAPDAWEEGPAPFCLKGGWCFSHPSPQGFPLSALAGVSGDDLWAAGEGRLLLHWDGASYMARSSPAEGRILDLWGLSANDIWGAGEGGTLIHWDGKTWARVCSPTQASLKTISGTAPDDVWVAGGSVYPQVRDNTLLHFDGQVWSTVEVAGIVQPLAVFALARDDVWVSGHNGAVAHWNGSQWTRQSLPSIAFSYQFRSIWGTGPTNLWANGHSTLDYVDGSPKPVQSGAVRRIVQRTPDDVWAVGDLGLALHFDGVRWTQAQPPAVGIEMLGGLTVISSREAWATGTRGSLLHWDGTSWASVPSAKPPNTPLVDVWGAATDDVWAATTGNLLHYDGTQWSEYAFPEPAYFARIHGTSPQDVWLVADDTQVWHWDGIAWTRRPSHSTSPRYGVWARAVDDVWMTRGGGWMTHWDGTAWTDIRTGALGSLGHVTGSGRDDVWATVSHSGLVRWDGASWSQHSPPLSPGFTTVESRAPGEVWIGSDKGILYYTP